MVTLFFTSFGYFDDADNRRTLGELARVLAPSGRLFLDLLNREPAVANLVPESERRVDGAVVHERVKELLEK